MKVHDLVARCAQAAESGDPLASVRAFLEQLRGDVAELERTLQYIPGVGGNPRQIFYRSPNLSMLKVCFPNGRRTPPHDHGTWAAILVTSGAEKNTLYRREGGALRRASEVTLERGSILGMRPDTIHVVECLGDAPTYGLHVYGGDVLELPRRMWHPQTLEEHALESALYETFAGIASGETAAPAGRP